jgi:hypothetical protein
MPQGIQSARGYQLGDATQCILKSHHNTRYLLRNKQDSFIYAAKPPIRKSTISGYDGLIALIRVLNNLSVVLVDVVGDRFYFHSGEVL